jgi:hypothetical protein
MSFPKEDRREFTAMHERMAMTLSSRGEHRAVEGADHLSIVTDRGIAGVVTDAIQGIVAEAEMR